MTCPSRAFGVFTMIVMGGVPQGGPPGPGLRLVGRVELAEPSAHPLGTIGGLVVTPSYLVVADGSHEDVQLYDRRGRHIRTIGRKGGGPGEFLQVSAVFALGDSLIGVADDGQRRISLVSVATGDTMGGTSYHGLVRNVAVARDRVWFGGLDAERLTGVFAWSPGSREAPIKLAAWPDTYRKSNPLAGINTGVAVAPYLGGVVYGFSGSNTIVAAGPDGAVTVARDIPAVHRRGVPTDIVEQLEGARRDFSRMFSLNSVLINMAALPSGELALVHYDQDIDGNYISAVPFLSVVRGDLGSACVDAVIPTAGHSVPMTAFRGDTLFVVEQELRGDAAVAVMSAYRVDTGNCRWIRTVAAASR